MTKQILYDSPEAAKPITIEGWVSKDGKVFTGKEAEHLARYSGSTHTICECGTPAKKPYTACPDCREKRQAETYRKLPLVEWDVETPLCIYRSDEYFYNEDDIDYHCEENKINESDLQLVLCEPSEPRILEASEFLEEIIPENDDYKIPEDIHKAAEEFNQTVRDAMPISWEASDKRVQLSKEIYCHACSVAGDAERSVYHLPPKCRDE